VTGGIAAYKSVELLRRLKQMGADVRVVMTAAAREFVGPLTFEALSGHPVQTGMFSKETGPQIPHIALAHWPDLVVIAPATANTVGRIAAGLADDLLSALVMASAAPVLLAPAMETNMYRNPIVTENLARLRGLGYRTVGPGTGFLASGGEGIGRMSEPEEIADAVVDALASTAEFAGRRFVVTAGRTEEDIDPVRFLTNRSTGKMGYAVAERARRRGAEVTLVSGPGELPPPAGVEVVKVRSVAQMREAVVGAFRETDVLVMAAAVLDFRAKRVAASKIKKTGAGLTLELEPTGDFLEELGRVKEERILVGFAMETENGVANARKKLEAKNLDLIVLNDLTVEGAGFGVDTNVVTLIDRDGSAQDLPKMSKREVADRILDRVREKLKKQ
jgi:phosphopantothenoylcysteine decarboxylase/phosphopantothenate--cysteine ligase